MKHSLIFLAGATGCAGSHALQAILAQDPDVRVRALVFKHTRPFIKDRRISYIYGDLRDARAAQRFVRGCDAVVLAAGNVTGVAGVVSGQAAQIRDNVSMNMNAITAAAEARVRRLVYVGSATLYQESDAPLREDDLDLNAEPPVAYFGIAWGMRFIEKLCRFWHNKTGMEVVVARATNIFGPYAKFDPRASHFIPAIIRKAVERQDPCEVWGSPEVTRDVLPAEDFGRAIAMMLRHPRISFDIFNIGSGVATTVGDVVGWACAAAGHQPREIKYLSDKPTTVVSRAFDISLAKEILGWVPSVSVKEGIERTVAWWQANKRTWRK
jgi:GDP-L-fucose synthase